MSMSMSMSIDFKDKICRLIIIVCFMAIIVYNVLFYKAILVEKVVLTEQNKAYQEVQVMLVKGQSDSALKLLNKYYPADKYGGSDAILFQRGWALFGLKDYKTAVTMFKEALEVNPLMLRNYEFLYYFGLSLYAMGDRESSAKICNAALFISPLNVKNGELKGLLQEIKNGKG